MKEVYIIYTSNLISTIQSSYSGILVHMNNYLMKIQVVESVINL